MFEVLYNLAPLEPERTYDFITWLANASGDDVSVRRHSLYENQVSFHLDKEPLHLCGNLDISPVKEIIVTQEMGSVIRMVASQAMKKTSTVEDIIPFLFSAAEWRSQDIYSHLRQFTKMIVFNGASACTKDDPRSWSGWTSSLIQELPPFLEGSDIVFKSKSVKSDFESVDFPGVGVEVVDGDVIIRIKPTLTLAELIFSFSYRKFV